MATAKTSAETGTSSTALALSALSLPTLASACRRCEACPLYCAATQAVFGEGPAHARIMLVGEQPGDEEDRRGHPFVGPAGAVLAEALAEAGLPRDEIYLTNAVKHFKFVERGKRRLHEKPNARERAACRPWLAAELRLVRPRIVVALGATAAASLLGPSVRVLRDRGQIRPLTPDTRDETIDALVTLHPSAVLRGPTPERRRELRAWLVGDLRLVAARVDVASRHRERASRAGRAVSE
jgi:DNA polymerase